MFRHTWRERTVVYLVKTTPTFKPNSPWNVPDEFTEGKIHTKNISLMEARDACLVHNKAAIARRAQDPAAWDGLWMIASACCRNKGPDALGLGVQERRCRDRQTAFTREELARLLQAADSMHLPVLPGVTPGEWWRRLIVAIVQTGESPLLAERAAGLPKWPLSSQAFHNAAYKLIKAAGIKEGNSFRGVQLAHRHVEKKGGEI